MESSNTNHEISTEKKSFGPCQKDFGCKFFFYVSYYILKDISYLSNILEDKIYNIEFEQQLSHPEAPKGPTFRIIVIIFIFLNLNDGN